MTGNFFKKLSTRLFSPLVVILILVLVVLSTYVPKVTKDNAIDTAIASAESTVKQYKLIRGYYTKNIIKKIVNGNEFKPHYNHKENANQIPLPATFIHDISNEYSQKGIISLKLYSPYPFPNRASRKLDSFGQKAWTALNNNAKQIFTTVETINGKETVRVALADTMVAQGCVNCHNSHPDTPKTGWKLNDVRGVLEVQVPIDKQLANATSLNNQIATIIILVLVATVGLLFFMFRKLISNRLRDVHGALVDIADGDGDLSQRLNDQPNDEIGVIATAFNQFMMQLSKTLGRINQQVDQLAENTKAMESISVQTQQDVAQQYQATEIMSDSVTQMNHSTEEMSGIAKLTAESSQETQQNASKGRSTVEQNLNSVKEFSTLMQDAAKVVNQLELDSQNIGGVLDVIRGIAEQTNLLALNAAIEAARAGEQGRGFAVVADEVRTLASRTQESTEEINSMIEQLQQGAKNAVHTIELGNKNIELSHQTAVETTEMIDIVTNAISGIQQQNTQLAQAAQTQTDVTQDMSNNIDDIRDVSQQTNTRTEELLALASEINNSVNKINKQLQKFVH
ncbi:hypothetical protein tinsulaeT_38510 [Thalassotalea insulae]|uniref:Methyl-accepting chemotaxis protein n=1 Tax=Thalassotalea insulae TaxID=2056778 RepID=A0ABQ6H272_9GAMM|nr:methyl-accepting chemotaxis protein [Thalassotalea insulae]GLX80511.1 hypothetical protein tinsulaeT_38510 [Thalassotalea insulae]